jgi:hypothetical protein
LKDRDLLLIAGGFVLLAVAGGGAFVMSSGGYPFYVTKLAQAIATAEGYFVLGSQPNRKNNPGDIETGGVVNTYNLPADGWNALYNQVSMMFDGTSAHYGPNMTIEQIGYVYSPDGAENWINNVSNYLGVPRTTSLTSLMG